MDEAQEETGEQKHCDICRGESDELQELVSGPVTQLLCPPCHAPGYEIQQRGIAAKMGEEYDPEYEYEDEEAEYEAEQHRIASLLGEPYDSEYEYTEG